MTRALLYVLLLSQLALLVRLLVTGQWRRWPLFTLWLICDTLKRMAYDPYTTGWYSLEPGRLILAAGSLAEAGMIATAGLGRSILRMAASLGLTLALVLLATGLRMQTPLVSELLMYREALYVGMGAFSFGLVLYLVVWNRRWLPHLALLWLYWSATALWGLPPAESLPHWLSLRAPYLASILACVAGWIVMTFRYRPDGELLRDRAVRASL